MNHLSESRMRENRTSGLMRGGSQTVIGRMLFQPVGSCLLYIVSRFLADFDI